MPDISALVARLQDALALGAAVLALALVAAILLSILFMILRGWLLLRVEDASASEAERARQADWAARRP